MTKNNKSQKIHTNPKDFLNKKTSALTLGVLAGIIVFILAMAYGVIQIVERSANDSAQKLVTNVVNHIEDKMDEVKNATRGMVQTINSNLDNPDNLPNLIHNFVADNEFVLGSTIAFEPDYFLSKGRYFAPYCYVDENDEVVDTQLGLYTDYYTEEWYSECKESLDEYWCEPYFDEGGAKIMMTTFSIPIFKNTTEFVAVLTADVGLEDLTNYISTIVPYKDSYIVLRSRIGTAFINENLNENIRKDTVVIKGETNIGWTVELVLPFRYFMHGNTSTFLIVSIFVVLSIILIFFLSRFLNMLQKRASDQYMDVIGALSEDFPYVVYVQITDNKENDTIVEYRPSEKLNEAIPEWRFEKSFTKRLDLMYKHIIYEQDKDMFYKSTRREKVLYQFEKSDTFLVNVRFVENGVILYYQMNFSAVRKQNKIVGMVFGLRSINEEIKKEKEQQQELSNALSLANTASKAKTEFLFNMSHDIRTPMNAILGYTDIALNHSNDTSRVNDSLKKIKMAGNHLLSLINDILEMSRIEAGKLELKNSPLDIVKAIEGVSHMGEALALQKDIAFTTIQGEIKNRYIFADELHINQAIINIISNAVKYTQNGGKVTYNVEQLGDPVDDIVKYKLVIQDNGIGMSKEFQEHLFESFARENTSTVSKEEGAGLGLSIVKNIIDLAGGTISFKSEKNVGTTFTLELPFKVMNESEIETYFKETNADKFDKENISFVGKKVLLVEDNELNREIASEILMDAGFVVETALDGSLAVDRLKEVGESYYDFILMDIQMPVMNGYDATREIRKMYPDSKLPIIALSANAFAEDKTASLESGMNDHVSKPIDIKELFDCLTKYLA